MATFDTYIAFDQRNVSFYSIFNEADRFSFVNDFNNLYDGVRYEDYLAILSDDGINPTETAFLGKGLTVDSFGRALSGEINGIYSFVKALSTALYYQQT